LGVMVLRRGMGGTYDQVGDGSVGAVWDAFIAWMEAEERKWKGVPPDDTFFTTYRRARSLLFANSIAHPEVAIRAYFSFVGKDAVRFESMLALLGSEKVIIEARARLDVMVGKVAMKFTRSMRGDLDDLFEILPDWARERFRVHLSQVRHPPTKIPLPEQIGRLCALPEGRIRLRGALCLISHAADGFSLAWQRQGVRQHVRHHDIMDDKSAGSADDVTRGLDLYGSSVLLPLDMPEPRAKVALAWEQSDATARKLALLVLGGEAERITAMLPALHKDASKYRDCMAERLRDFGQERRGKRLETVASIVPALPLILSAIENRIAQLEGLLTALADQMPTARERMAQGLRVGFDWTGPVVRADGSLATTDQTIHFELFTEGELLIAAHDRGYRREHVQRRMPKDFAAGWEYGDRHVAGRWRKIHLVYRSTEPADAGGESVEPFWVDLFRWDVLDWSDRLSEKVKAERRRRIKRFGLGDYQSPKRGLLVATEDDREIALYARGEDPEGDESRLVIPLVEFYHAMSFARVAATYGIRWGARIGEILQIRLGPDCFRMHAVDGVMQPYLSLRPKGWSTNGKFGLDGATAGAMKSAKLFTNSRFCPGLVDEKGELTLPSVAFCQHDRCLPPARHLFQHDGVMVSERNLTIFCNVLLVGVVDMNSHDGRYTFATALGLEGASYEAIGFLLHHSPDSRMPMQYDMSAAIAASDAAERFNARIEAALAALSLRD
jgi:hypothetical protein